MELNESKSFSTLKKPTVRPKRPQFSSGPTCKHPGWSLDALSTDMLGRAHRTPAGKARLQSVLDLTRDILEIPEDYFVGITPGSATGSNECAFWSLLGARGVDVFAWELFGRLWVYDIQSQLKVEDCRVYSVPFGDIPDLNQHEQDRDVVFTWNGTTSGVCVPNLDWISPSREGLTFCDATSAAFCFNMDWSKLDVTSFSWQKGLGSEAGHGMLVLSPRAMERLKTYTPEWPIPRLFRLKREGNILKGIFEAETINTPSMLCVQDCINALQWAKSVGGLSGLVSRVDANFKVIDAWVSKTSWIRYLAKDPNCISPVSVCLEVLGDNAEERIQTIVETLRDENIAYDIKNHRDAPPSLRIWCGPTVEREDIEALLPWIESVGR